MKDPASIKFVPKDIITDYDLRFEIHVELIFPDDQRINKNIRYRNVNHRNFILGFIADLIKWKNTNHHYNDCMNKCMIEILRLEKLTDSECR